MFKSTMPEEFKAFYEAQSPFDKKKWEQFFYAMMNARTEDELRQVIRDVATFSQHRGTLPVGYTLDSAMRYLLSN